MKLSAANVPQPITEFYQKDLDQKKIVFKLFDDVSDTEDFFVFTLVDQGGNELVKQRYVFQWSFISLKRELMVVDEVEKEQACAFFAITSKIPRNSTEHKESKYSSESKLQIKYICLVEILNIFKVISKMLNPWRN